MKFEDFPTTAPLRGETEVPYASGGSDTQISTQVRDRQTKHSRDAEHVINNSMTT
jgi:hypothetical protein